MGGLSDTEPQRPLEFERIHAQVRGLLFGGPAAPSRLGRYEVGERLGAGGMGVVYAGFDPELGRKVAIKLVRPDRGGDVAGRPARARLLREAQAMARLSSPHAVTVYEAGTYGDQVFVVMEHVEGVTLSQWLLASPRTWREVQEIFLQAGRGLVAAHRAGLVHRDFKPDNVLLGVDGRARVADFGLAYAAAEASAGGPAPLAGSSLAGGTLAGALIGSIAYMSPEQHRGAAVDARSDQFSFCVSLWEALHGAPPFPGATPEEVRARVLAGVVAPPPEGARVPAALRRVALRGLQVDPARRFPDMAALLSALERAGRGRGRAALVLAGVAAAALGVLLQGQARRDMCEASGDEVAAAWGDAQRAAVRRAFQATGRPEAAEVWEQVARRLDGYAADWAAARGEACRAAEMAEGTGPSEQAHLRIACLDRRLGELRALVDALAGEPDALLANAVKAAAKLRPLAICREQPEEELRVEPSDPAVAARVQVLSGRIDDVAALLAAGEGARALTRAQEVVGEARRLGHDPTTAEALVLLGALQSQTGAYAEAEATLFAAALAAERGRNPSALARARTELVVAIGYGQGRADEALRWGDLALAALHHGGGAAVEVRLRTALGLVQARRGDVEAARGELVRALALGEATLGREHLGVATILDHLADLRADAGAAAEARALLRRALEIRERTLGSSHADAQRTRDRLAALAG